MTKPEHAPRPGANWEQHLVRTETVIDDDTPDLGPNRKTRRAMARRMEEPMTTPSPFRCPIPGCQGGGPDMVTHLAAEHDASTLLGALTHVTAGLPDASAEEPK